MWKKFWKKYGAMITAAVFLTAAGFTYSFAGKQPLIAEQSCSELALESQERDASLKAEGILAEPESAPEIFYVYICGEVKEPGVYQLPEGSRIVDAVEAAGGLLESAAAEAVNLAEKVSDGMQIVILSQEEMLEIAKREAEAAAGLVNLNQATKEQLMELPGIGASRAEDIIRYRESAGGFQTIEEIMQVPGIKDAGFQKIKDRIVV